MKDKVMENQEEEPVEHLPLFSSDDAPEPEVEVEVEVKEIAEDPQDQEGVQLRLVLNNTKLSVDATGIPVTSFGPYLRTVRERNGIKVSDLAEMTKLSSTYINALEEEDYDSLPPLVYVLAYIKKISEYYSLPQEIVEEITRDVQFHLEYEAPDDPSKALIDVEIGKENPILLKRIIILSSLCLLLFVSLISAVIFVIVSPRESPETSGISATESVVTESKLKNLNGKIELEFNELKQKNAL